MTSQFQPVEIMVGVKPEDRQKVIDELVQHGFTFDEIDQSPDGIGESAELHGYGAKVFLDPPARRPRVYFALSDDKSVDQMYATACEISEIVEPIANHGPYREFTIKIAGQLELCFWQRLPKS